MEQLKKMHYAGQVSELQKHEQTLKQYLEANPPHTSAEAQSVIEELTGLKRSPTQVRAFMKREGMRYRKVGYVPGKVALPEKQAEQEAFREEHLVPTLEETRKGE